jgi:hypothetical protein
VIVVCPLHTDRPVRNAAPSDDHGLVHGESGWQNDASYRGAHHRDFQAKAFEPEHLLQRSLRYAWPIQWMREAVKHSQRIRHG